MRYFYDTEFIEYGSTIYLISIGIVAEDGREYYAINEQVGSPRGLGGRIARHGWLMENVIPHLPLREPVKESVPPSLDMADSRVKSRTVIADEVLDFIRAGDGVDHELWAYYGAYDHVALCQLWGPMINLPDDIPMWTHELMQAWEQAGRPDQPPQIDEHNALADARWNRDLYRAITNAPRE